MIFHTERSIPQDTMGKPHGHEIINTLSSFHAMGEEKFLDPFLLMIYGTASITLAVAQRDDMMLVLNGDDSG